MGPLRITIVGIGLSLLLCLNACGNKGELYLPDNPAPQKQKASNGLL